MTIRNVRRKLDAFQQGGPIPVFKSRVTRINGNPIVVAFVRMAGENRPWGIAYGHAQDKHPNLLSVPDPRAREAVQEMMEKFASWFLTEAGVHGFSQNPVDPATTELADLPQIWMPGPTHVSMLHFIQYQYQKSRRSETKQSLLGALGRFSGWLFQQSRLKGNQIVIDATKLLNELYEFPADDFSISHLGVQLTWLTVPGGIDAKREAAFAAARETVSITMSPDYENKELGGLVRDLRDDFYIQGYTSEIASKIAKKINPELERRWRMVVKAHDIAQRDPRQENSQVESALLPELLNNFDRGFNKQEAMIESEEDTFTMSPDGGYSAYATARDFLTVTHFEEKWLAEMVHSDTEILKDSIFDGTSFEGTVVEVGTKLVGAAEKIIWTIKLAPQSSRLYKKKQGNDLAIFGLPKRKLKVEDFEKIDQDWYVTVSWGTGAPLEMQGFKAVPSNPQWVNFNHWFVPSYETSFFLKALQALSKARSGHFAAWFDSSEVNEVVDVVK